MHKSNTVAANLKTPQGKSIKKQLPALWKDRITHQQYQQLRDVFLIFDEDGSGTIDPQQIVKVLQDLGLSNRNPYILNIVWALRQQNKILSFDDFVEVVCLKTGQCKTRDGIRRIFDLYDKQQTGEIGFDQLKQISRFIGQTMTDDDILQMMHSVFITNKTQSSNSFNFEQFYQVISSRHQHKHHN